MSDDKEAASDAAETNESEAMTPEQIEEKIKAAKTVQDKRMEMYKRRKKDVADEIEASAEEWPEHEGEDESGQREGISQEKVQGIEQEGVDTDEDDGYVEVKIYGQTHRVPREEVERYGGLRAYQIERAANARLQWLSSEERRIAAEREQFFEAQRVSGQGDQSQASTSDVHQRQDEPPSTGARGDDAKAELGEKVEQWREAMYSGNEEDMAKALQDIATYRASGEKAGVDEEALLDRLSQRLIERQAQNAAVQQPESQQNQRVMQEYYRMREAQREEANRVMDEEFSDIMENPRYMNYARNVYNDAVKNPVNAGRSLADLAREAGNVVRTDMGLRTPKERLDARRDMKRRIPKSHSTQRRPAPKTDQPTMSNRDYLALMKRARGQAMVSEGS